MAPQKKEEEEDNEKGDGAEAEAGKSKGEGKIEEREKEEGEKNKGEDKECGENEEQAEKTDEMDAHESPCYAKQSQLDDEDSATITLKWGRKKIQKAFDKVSTPGRSQYSEVVKTQVPPFHFSKYDMVLPKKAVLKMNKFIEKNPKGVYTILASPIERYRADLEANSDTFIKLKVRKDVAKKEKGLWKSKLKKGEKEHYLMMGFKQNTMVFSIKYEGLHSSI